MARQEANNTFQDGMIKDLNPINTPNTVLTDCLNGTLITYNGNEFILQNDLGNYKLENCKLPVNFIPVGIKSYGDILYIVSYNPITKMAEIGSYPAPKEKFSSEKNSNDVKPISYFKDTEGDTQPTDELYPGKLYSELDDRTLSLFIGNEDIENYKLNPGDKYILTTDQSDLNFIYQTLDWHILDEDRKIYDLDDSLIIENEETAIGWDIPGWLAAKYKICVPDRFNVNIRTLDIPEFINLNEQPIINLKLSTQLIISNLKFQKILNQNLDENIFKHLKVRIIPTINSGVTVKVKIDEEEKEITNGSKYLDINCVKYNYQDDIITAFNNIEIKFIYPSVTDVSNFSFGEIKVLLVPLINQDDLILIYDQFKTNLTFNTNALNTTNDIKIAENIYKWSCDKDSCTVTFNIEGPFINASKYSAEYEIEKLVPTPSSDYSTFYLQTVPSSTIINSKINNLVLFGQNTINIPWDTENNPVFLKESGLYKFSIIIYNSEDHREITRKSLLLIPSEVFNEWFTTQDSYLKNITSTEWLNKYIEHTSINCAVQKFDVSGLDWSSPSYKWENDENWIELTCELKDGNWVFYKTNDAYKTPVTIETLIREKYNLNNEEVTPYISNVPITEKLYFRPSFLNSSITKEGDIVIQTPLQGDLWTVEDDITLSLTNDDKHVEIINAQSETPTLDKSNLGYIEISFTSTPEFLKQASKPIRPFAPVPLKGTTGYYTFPIITLYCCYIPKKGNEQWYFTAGGDAISNDNGSFEDDTYDPSDTLIPEKEMSQYKGLNSELKAMFDNNNWNVAICRLFSEGLRQGNPSSNGCMVTYNYNDAENEPEELLTRASGNDTSLPHKVRWGLLFKANKQDGLVFVDVCSNNYVYEFKDSVWADNPIMGILKTLQRLFVVKSLSPLMTLYYNQGNTNSENNLTESYIFNNYDVNYTISKLSYFDLPWIGKNNIQVIIDKEISSGNLLDVWTNIKSSKIFENQKNNIEFTISITGELDIKNRILKFLTDFNSESSNQYYYSQLASTDNPYFIEDFVLDTWAFPYFNMKGINNNNKNIKNWSQINSDKYENWLNNININSSTNVSFTINNTYDKVSATVSKYGDAFRYECPSGPLPITFYTKQI